MIRWGLSLVIAVLPAFTFAQSTTTASDGFIMGAGRWTCADVLQVADSGSPIQKGQLAGWVLGFWSAATLTRETSFVDTVQGAGGERIYVATLDECRKAPGSVLLYRLSREMVRNTK